VTVTCLPTGNAAAPPIAADRQIPAAPSANPPRRSPAEAGGPVGKVVVTER